MSRSVRQVPTRYSRQLLDTLAETLTGAGPALLPTPDGEPGRRLLAVAQPNEPTDDAVALLLPTSGSTGDPKVVELSREALVSSATATHDRLGGPGTWVMSLPLTHVAGWQVLVRSVIAGTQPSVLSRAPFAPTAFAAAVAALPPSGPRYASLVPTQLHRLLDDARAARALASLDGVLVGGAATPPPLVHRAVAVGVPLHLTYGMSETSGGCVYGGVPLDGVRVRVDEAARVLLAGPVLAEGYRGDPATTAASFVHDDDGVRWFRTGDRGVLADGRLQIEGRLDDVIISGGANVHPAAVERVVAALPGVHAVLVVGLPDAEWGEAVVALVEGETALSPDDVRAAVTEQLGRECAPRHVLAVDAVPVRGIGKPDRLAGARIAAQRLA